MKNRLSTQNRRDSGLSILEVTLAITMFVVVALGTGLVLMTGVSQRRQTFESYQALNTLRDLTAEMQETANLPQDLAAQEGIGALYAKYHGSSTTVPEVPNGQISVTIFPNETTVPTELGGRQDLNFDGDDEDNHTASNGTDLLLVPIRLTMTLGQGNESQTTTIHRLLTQTVN